VVKDGVFSPEFRERYIETHHTGELVAVDTFFVGTLKGVGRIYLQSVIDCHSHYAWGRLYTSKLPVNAVYVLNEDVLPYFEQHQGRNMNGRTPYQAFIGGIKKPETEKQKMKKAA
jgi:hypothetical protein